MAPERLRHVMCFLICWLPVYAAAHERPPLVSELLEQKDVRSFSTSPAASPDYFQVFSPSGKLIQELRDRNHDGRIDEITTYADAGKPIITKRDTRFTGRIDQIEEREVSGEFVLVRTKEDLSGTGAFHTIRLERTPLLQPELSHTPEDQKRFEAARNELKGLTSLVPLFEKRAELPPVKGGYHKTSYGFLIHESCVKAFEAEEMNQVLHETLTRGAICLWDLKTSAAKENLIKIAALLGDLRNPPKLSCPEEDPTWKGDAVGHATVPLGRNHPTIYLRPLPLDVPGISRAEMQQLLRATIFHELMHNLGYLHGIDIDYPYACQACCFPEEENAKEQKRLGCEICQGGFRNTRDKAYLRKLVAFGQVEKPVRRYGNEAVFKALRESPNDRELRVLLLQTQESTALRVGLAGLLEKTLTAPSKAEQAFIQEALKDKDLPGIPPLLPAATAAASAYLSLVDGKLDDAENAVAEIKLPPPPALKPGQHRLVSPEESALQDVLKRLAWQLWDLYKAQVDNAKDESAKKKAQASANRIFDRLIYSRAKK